MDQVHNLQVLLSPALSLRWLMLVGGSAFHQLQTYLGKVGLASIINVLVTFSLDYCHDLYMGLTSKENSETTIGPYHTYPTTAALVINSFPDSSLNTGNNLQSPKLPGTHVTLRTAFTHMNLPRL